MEPGKDYPTTWGGSPATPGMTEEEQYIFDLAGFVVIRNCLSPDEVAACNAAIDRHAHLITRPETSYSHGSQALRGENNLITKLAWALGGDLSAAGDRMTAAYELAQARSGEDNLVTLGSLRDALSAAVPEKAAALGAVAEQAVGSQHLTQAEGCAGEDRVVQLGTSRGDLGGMLQWDQVRTHTSNRPQNSPAML